MNGINIVAYLMGVASTVTAGLILWSITEWIKRKVFDRDSIALSKSLLDVCENGIKVLPQGKLVSDCDESNAEIERYVSVGRLYFLSGVELLLKGDTRHTAMRAIMMFIYAVDQFERSVELGGPHSFMDASLANVFELFGTHCGLLAHWVSPYPQDAVRILERTALNPKVHSYIRTYVNGLLEKLYRANPGLKTNVNRPKEGVTAGNGGE